MYTEKEMQAMEIAREQYRIRDEYISEWGDGWDNLITMDEIKRLANEWGVSVDELMQQVEKSREDKTMTKYTDEEMQAMKIAIERCGYEMK